MSTVGRFHRHQQFKYASREKKEQTNLLLCLDLH